MKNYIVKFLLMAVLVIIGGCLGGGGGSGGGSSDSGSSTTVKVPSSIIGYKLVETVGTVEVLSGKPNTLSSGDTLEYTFVSNNQILGKGLLTMPTTSWSYEVPSSNQAKITLTYSTGQSIDTLTFSTDTTGSFTGTHTLITGSTVKYTGTFIISTSK
ncbi:MAG: hypothetical protein HW380_2231 [Magnetococcales bacterium]|nr:hypothetical protein [Magnetococcales bacterium]HIJ83728.1 hypothetical protein [Magnetococcales bacterium]